jgi:hypothetical protein
LITPAGTEDYDSLKKRNDAENKNEKNGQKLR